MALNEIPPDLLTVVLPVVLGVGMVLGTVVFIFWLGSGSKRTYEEAKALASKKAEEKLKEKEIEHATPKPKKLRKNFRRKKTEEPQEESVGSQSARKGILKIGEAAATDEHTPDRHKVDFKLDIASLKAREEGTGKKLLHSPPTPYPKELSNRATRLPAKEQPPPRLPAKEQPPPRLLFDDAEEVQMHPPPPVQKEEPKKKAPVVVTKPVKAANPPPAGSIAPASSSESSGMLKKVKARSKPQTAAGEWVVGMLFVCC